MGMTMTQKILAKHAGLESVRAGQLIQAKLDLVLGNDITTPVAINEFESAGFEKVFDKSRIAMVMDHFAPNKDIKSATQCKQCRTFARRFDIDHFYDVGTMGIEHALLPEQRLVAPGEAVIGADSHTCTYGALGAFSTGVGSTDMGAAMAAGETWFKVPSAIKVNLTGKLRPFVSGKDVILTLIGMIGVDGARYQSIEFSGEGVKNLTIYDRLTICNMAIEAGGKNGIFPVDDVTRAYVEGRVDRPWTAFEADPDAEYERVIDIDLGKVDCTVAWPHLPENAHSAREGSDIAIDQIVIGSCTNGQLPDMAAAAAILKGHHLAPNVRGIIIPATQEVYRACMHEGYTDIFLDAGCIVSTPTCGPCLGGYMGILAWLIGGAIMIVCILAFSAMAQKYEKVNGIVDYAEAIVGKRYGYYIGWFLSTTYYPTLTSALAWLSARYTLVFVTSVDPDFPLIVPAEAGGCIIGPECLALMLFYMVCAYAVNALSPKLAGKFQVATTVIKFIPLALMAVVGIIFGLANGMLTNNFTTPAVGYEVTGSPLFAAVCATAFAYEGWIIATSINAELKDSKRNLPKALLIGGLIIVATYILYYIGVAGGATNQELCDSGATAAFINVFGPVLGNILNLFIAISCMGTMNGLMLGCCRGPYSLAARGEGPHPELFGQVDKVSNLPNNSAILGLFYCAAWGLYFYLSNLAGTWSHAVAFVGTPFESVIFFFDPTELPIITIYALYIPIFINWMKKATDESALRRYVIPTLAICGSIFMVIACLIGHKMGNFWYLLTFAVIMLIGKRFAKNNA